MPAFEVTGGRPLEGQLRTPGSKNAVLPLLAASCLFKGAVTFKNVPAIVDVGVMLDLLRALGASVDELGDGAYRMQAASHPGNQIPAQLANRLRASVLLMGPVLTRTGQVTLPQPGGDLIGRRPIDVHIAGFQTMGAMVSVLPDTTKLSGQLRGADLYLPEASVTATENLLMGAVLADGTTVIRNAAQEAHVVALAQFLASAGAKIDGIGTSTLTIHGRAGQPLDGPATVTVPPDELDAGTWAIATAITGGCVAITPFPHETLRPLVEKLRQIGVVLEASSDGQGIVVKQNDPPRAFQLKVGPAPGFPTDLQPPMAVLATQAHGPSLIHDWMYERRFGYIDELIKLGANIIVCDPHRVLVTGPTQLTGRRILSPDIRAGIAFVLAALAAKGPSIIDHADIIERGYADLVPRLQSLGAQITRISRSEE